MAGVVVVPGAVALSPGVAPGAMLLSPAAAPDVSPVAAPSAASEVPPEVAPVASLRVSDSLSFLPHALISAIAAHVGIRILLIMMYS